MAAIKSIEEKAKAYNEAIERAKVFKEHLLEINDKGYADEMDYIFPELRESEDERIRKDIVEAVELHKDFTQGRKEHIYAWLENQGEHTKFRDSIQVGDKVTKNEDGVLVNLSQLKRVAKKDENQGEQKPAGKVEPKFKIGDWVVRNGKTLQISGIDTVLDGTFHYWFTKGTWLSSKKMENAMLWTIQDAKDGDVISWDDSKCIAIFKNIYDKDSFNSYGFVGGCTGTFESRMSYHDIEGAHPATKEQRDQLEKAMADAGYTFDFEKKELKKIEQKPAWSEEDETVIDNLIYALANDRIGNNRDEYVDWLKSLKDRVQPQPQSHWKPTESQMASIKQAVVNMKASPCYDSELVSLYNDLKAL